MYIYIPIYMYEWIHVHTYMYKVLSFSSRFIKLNYIAQKFRFTKKNFILSSVQKLCSKTCMLNYVQINIKDNIYV